jgi:DNA-binding CsgD family transcriptional regulator
METDDGDWKWIKTVGEVIERDEDSEPKRAVGLHIDIDDSKTKERHLKESNECLQCVKDASKEMISAGSQQEVGNILTEAGRDIFADAAFYVWEDGVLRSGKKEISKHDGARWEAFTQGDTILTEPNGNTFCYSDRDHGLADGVSMEGTFRLDIPVGGKGVFSVFFSEFPGSMCEFAAFLVTSAETALEKVEKENHLQETADKLANRNKELRRVTEIDEIIRGIIKKVIEADSLKSIKEAVCDQILEVDGWEYAWFVETGKNGPEPSCCCGNGNLCEGLQGALDDSPISESLEDGEVRIIDDIAKADICEWRQIVLNNGYLSVATVPIRYGSRSFGVLEVYSSETGAFRGEYSNALIDAAEITSCGFNLAEKVNSILSGEYNRITLSIDIDEVNCFFSELVDRFGEESSISAVIPGPDGTVVQFKTNIPWSELHEVADKMGVEVTETLNGYSATVPEMSVIDKAIEFGGRVLRYAPSDGDVHVDINIPQATDTREFVNAVSKEYNGAELVAQKTDETAVYSTPSMDELTERQETVLRLAYENGFFKTPREKTGEEIAELMGITATTFHQHLRAAEKQIVDSMFSQRGSGE